MATISSFHDLIGRDASSILWWQMSIRALLVFAYGLVLIRLFGRRAFSQQTPLDIVVAIMVGSNLSRTITGNASFVPTLVATGLMVVVYWLLEHAAARSDFVSRWLKGLAVPLTRDGRLDRDVLRRSRLTQADVEEAARESGKPGLEAVDEAVFERSGKISTQSRG